MKIFLVVGARPNFIKLAALVRELEKRVTRDWRVVHTGQHYDYEMSRVFFNGLELPEPDYHLDIADGSSHAEQTGHIMIMFERLCKEEKPDMVVVLGDVNSTLACALAARKLNIQIAHVEAGLRCWDWTMPEETNRTLVDHMSDVLFCTERQGLLNLREEGRTHPDVRLVGDVMVDTLKWQLPRLTENFMLESLKKAIGKYAYLTMHRPSNVDDPHVFASLVETINKVAKRLPVIFPMHPRTKARMETLLPEAKLDLHRVVILEPQSYNDSISIMKDAEVVLTDSGGMQVETTFLGVPCLTLRTKTERPVTLGGTNRLVGHDEREILRGVNVMLDGPRRWKMADDANPCWNLWDGRAAERIIDILIH